MKWYTDYRYGAAQVREAILTSALLRLPKTMSRAHKEARVDQILAELVRLYASSSCSCSLLQQLAPGNPDELQKPCSF